MRCMRERRTDLERHRAQEFEDFAAGAGALHARQRRKGQGRGALEVARHQDGLAAGF